MKQKVIITILVCMLFSILTVTVHAQETSKKIKIGVYDNRAIATAFFGSKYNDIVAKQAEFHAAMKARDTLKINKLKDWGPKFQRKMKFQGFCQVPVNDLLAYVSDKIPEVIRNTGVDIVGWAPDYSSTGINIQLVDITDELVALYDPSEEVLAEVKKVKETEPTLLEELTHINYEEKR